jgi:hypothetical protein
MIQKQENLLQQDISVHKKQIRQLLVIGHADFQDMLNYLVLNQILVDFGKN